MLLEQERELARMMEEATLHAAQAARAAHVRAAGRAGIAATSMAIPKSRTAQSQSDAADSAGRPLIAIADEFVPAGDVCTFFRIGLDELSQYAPQRPPLESCDSPYCAFRARRLAARDWGYNITGKDAQLPAEIVEALAEASPRRP